MWLAEKVPLNYLIQILNSLGVQTSEKRLVVIFSDLKETNH